MAKRHKMHKGYSKKSFRAGASRIHPKNHMFSGGNPMRGGIRL